MSIIREEVDPFHRHSSFGWLCANGGPALGAFQLGGLLFSSFSLVSRFFRTVSNQEKYVSLFTEHKNIWTHFEV